MKMEIPAVQLLDQVKPNQASPPNVYLPVFWILNIIFFLFNIVNKLLTVAMIADVRVK